MIRNKPEPASLSATQKTTLKLLPLAPLLSAGFIYFAGGSIPELLQPVQIAKFELEIRQFIAGILALTLPISFSATRSIKKTMQSNLEQHKKETSQAF